MVEVTRSVVFVVGDWIVQGSERFGYPRDDSVSWHAVGSAVLRKKS